MAPWLHFAGKLHFVKFETSRVEDAVAFIEAKGLHHCRGPDGKRGMRIMATGAVKCRPQHCRVVELASAAWAPRQMDMVD